MKINNSISVVIVARNAEETIGRSLESLKKQTIPPEEIIFVDDGSTDMTKKIVEGVSKKDKKIKIISTKGLGISKARNLGNLIAKSKYIAVLDSDDSFRKRAIEDYKKFIIKNQNADLIYGDCVYVINNLKIKRNYPEQNNNDKIKKDLFQSIFSKFKHSSMLYKKSSFIEAGMYDELLPMKVDYDLLLRFIKNKKRIIKIPKVISYHYKHKNQISRKRLEGIKIFFKIIDKYEENKLYNLIYKGIKLFSETLKILMRG